jgi:hypothetical protein
MYWRVAGVLCLQWKRYISSSLSLCSGFSRYLQPVLQNVMIEWPCFVLRRSGFVGIGNRGSILGIGKRVFFVVFRLALGPTQPPVCWELGKRPEREAIKNAWRNASSSLYVVKVWYLIKRRDNFAVSFHVRTSVHLSTRPCAVEEVSPQICV